MTIPPETLIAVALVILVGYTIFGATGFGASPITIPRSSTSARGWRSDSTRAGRRIRGSS